MLDANKQLFDFLNITEWHSAGYTGSRGLTATQEAWDTDKYNPNGMVIPTNTANMSQSAHPINTAKCFFEVAPDRQLIQLPFKVDASSDTTAHAIFFPMIDAMIKFYRVDIMFGALISNLNGKILDPYLSEIGRYFTYYMNTTDDDGLEANNMIQSDYIYGAGSYVLNEHTKQISLVTAKERLIDTLTCVPTEIYIPYTNNPYKPDERCRKFYGASCASAVLAGMMSLVNDFFIDKIGRPLSRTEAKHFVEKNCEHIERGVNVFKLPNINEIDVHEYTERRTLISTDVPDLEKHASGEQLKDIIMALNSGTMWVDEDGNFNGDRSVTRNELARAVSILIKQIRRGGY